MGERDAFGRAVGAEDGAPAHARAHRAAAGEGRSRSSPGGRRAGAPLLTLLFVVAGAAAVVATLRAAVERSHDEPAAVAFALSRDALATRSLLRPAPMRRAIDRAAAALRADEHVVRLSAAPNRLTLTVADGQEQTRWISATAAGDVEATELATTTTGRGFDVRALDVAPGLRAAARRYRQLAPAARDPSLALITDARGRPVGWSLAVTGVRSADASTRFGLDGARR